MKKNLIVCIGALFMILLCGCGEYIVVNGVSYRVLSQEEERAMVSFARLTLLNSGEDMTAAQRNYITYNEPEIYLSYKGNRSGKASYEWCCSDDVLFRVNCEGEFLTSNMNVNARKINLREDLKKGESSKLERLTLQEIEF